MTEQTDKTDEDGFAVGARPLCPFCSKPWSATMMRSEQEGASYESCGWSTVTLNIICDGCDRLIYSKDIYERDW